MGVSGENLSVSILFQILDNYQLVPNFSFWKLFIDMYDILIEI